MSAPGLTTDEIRNRLIKLKDLKYREFSLGLCPGIDPGSMIGVRLPDIRALAKDIKGSEAAEEFMKELPHRYFEEYHLHMFLIEEIRDFDICISRIDDILPYVDNWAVCDHSTPSCIKKHPERAVDIIYRWIDSGDTFTVRYGIKRLMDIYLDDRFRPEYLDKIAMVKSEEYYVKMMAAWFFATALAKQYDEAVHIIEDGALEKWTHNKAIQKAIESYRITDERKAYLRSLKIR